MGLVVISHRYVYGVPAPDDRRPIVGIPHDAERVKLRFRNDGLAHAVIKVGDEVFRRPLLDEGSVWRVAGWDLEQGRNVTFR